MVDDHEPRGNLVPVHGGDIGEEVVAMFVPEAGGEVDSS